VTAAVWVEREKLLGRGFDKVQPGPHDAAGAGEQIERVMAFLSRSPVLY
jgi:hypothetical protein